MKQATIQARDQIKGAYEYLLISALCIISFIVRLASLGRYVTPDEPVWVYRSIRFHDALVNHAWSTVPSTGHPGVTTMWLGTAGVTIQQVLHPQESSTHLDWIRRMAWLAPENGEAFRHLAFFLTPSRIAIALTTILGLLLIYILLRSIFGTHVALLAWSFMALDPFLTGHSGILHTDALLTIFCTLSTLSLLAALKFPNHRWAWGILSGAMGGLSVLTKLPGIFTAIVTLAMIVISLIFRRLRLCQAWKLALAWGISGITVFYLLFPRMWVTPLETVQDLLQAPAHYTEQTLMPIFFAGHVTQHPGPEFYIVVTLVRISPLVLLGLLISTYTFTRRLHLREDFFYLGTFAVGYFILVSSSAKKYDRYLLPIFPMLAIIAALGWVEKRSSRCFSCHILPWYFPLPLQILLFLSFSTYPLTYANPLLGGPHIAAQWLSLDWGESVGAAARKLNQHPNAEQLVVATDSVPSFASVFVGHTLSLNHTTIPLADYVVPSSLAPTPPLPHPTIYTNTEALEQADYLINHNAQLILLDADTPLLHTYQGPGHILAATHYLHEMDMHTQVLKYWPGDDYLWGVYSPSASPITALYLRRTLSTLATPLTTVTVGSAEIVQYAMENTPQVLDVLSELPVNTSSFIATLSGGQFTLIDSVIPVTVTWPDSLRVTLRWQVGGSPSVDYRLFLALYDDQGYLWGSADQWILNPTFFPTSKWEPQEWNDATYEVALPPALPPSTYTVEVSLYDGATGSIQGLVGPDGSFKGTQVVIGNIHVHPPLDPPSPSDLHIPQPLNISAGPLTLLGTDSFPDHILSGDHIAFSVFWQANRKIRENYRVRFRWIGYETHEVMETIVPLNPYPTSQWRVNERIKSGYILHIPPTLPPARYRLTLNVLDEKGHPLWNTDYVIATIEILPRERLFELPETVPHSLEFTFGDKIRLLGYDVGSTEVTAGEPVALSFYWQAEGLIDRDYMLFVQLIGTDDLAHGQVDQVPGNGLSPTSTWATGQIIIDNVSLQVTPDTLPGVYQINFGFYDLAHGERLIVADAEGHILPNNQATLPVRIQVVSPASSP